MSELKPWLERILAAQTIEEVFATVDEFRPLFWSDEERASMSKTYNAKLYQLNANNALNSGANNNKILEREGKTKTSSNISKQEAGNQRGESTSSIQELDEDEIV